jgi:imidazolonepropionase-like amidohydrolase
MPISIPQWNTAFDFKVAVRAGVDEINHLPGRFSFSEKDFENYVLKKEDVRLAGQKGIYVVPTYSLLLGNKDRDKAYTAKAQEVQHTNLKLLHRYGVKITFGADSYNKTSQREAFYLKDLGVFSNLELIRMWAENTPQTIFPNRKIAFLKDGYEASFIALPENPLENFEAVKNIRTIFKQGHKVEIDQKQ